MAIRFRHILISSIACFVLFLESLHSQISLSYHGIEFHKVGLAYHFNDKIYSEFKVFPLFYKVRNCIGYSNEVQTDLVFDLNFSYNFYRDNWIETFIGFDAFGYKFKSEALYYSYKFHFGVGGNLGLRVYPVQRLKNLSMEFQFFPNTGLKPFPNYFQTEFGLRYKFNFS